jgi:hypothetical protein
LRRHERDRPLAPEGDAADTLQTINFKPAADFGREVDGKEPQQWRA